MLVDVNVVVLIVLSLIAGCKVRLMYDSGVSWFVRFQASPD